MKTQNEAYLAEARPSLTSLSALIIQSEMQLWLVKCKNHEIYSREMYLTEWCKIPPCRYHPITSVNHMDHQDIWQAAFAVKSAN